MLSDTDKSKIDSNLNNLGINIFTTQVHSNQEMDQAQNTELCTHPPQVAGQDSGGGGGVTTLSPFWECSS